MTPPDSVDAVHVSDVWFGLFATATIAASHVTGEPTVKVAAYVPGVAAGPFSASRKVDDAVGCCVKPVPGWKTEPAEAFVKPMSKSFVPVVVTLGLTTLTFCVPLSLPIMDIASSGEEIFDPFTTNTDITRGRLCDKFMVMV